MYRLTRKFTLTVLLAIVLSQVALSAHAATHWSADRVVCDLCAANSAGCVPIAVAAQSLVLPEPGLDRGPFFASAPVVRSIPTVHPRGPPIFN